MKEFYFTIPSKVRNYFRIKQIDGYPKNFKFNNQTMLNNTVVFFQTYWYDDFIKEWAAYLKDRRRPFLLLKFNLKNEYTTIKKLYPRRFFAIIILN